MTVAPIRRWGPGVAASLAPAVCVVAALAVCWLLLSAATFTLAASAAFCGLSFTYAFRFRDAHPVVWRMVSTIALVQLAVVITYHLSFVTNNSLAGGAAISIVILGLSFLTGVSGQISLGNGAFMGAGAFVVAIWANHHSSTPLVVSLLLAALTGALLGVVLGLPATRLRGPYLAGMTLAFAFAFSPDLLLDFSSWTGGDGGLQIPTPATAPQWLDNLFSAPGTLGPNAMWFADIAIVVAGVAFFFMANLLSSRTGRRMRLVRDNEVAAELVGIGLPRARITAFVVSAAYAGLGGGVLAITSYSVSPTNFTLAVSITLLSLMVIGGIGTLSGAIIGGFIYAFSQSWITWLINQTGLNPLGNLATNLNNIIFGSLLILAMLFAPLGIAGTVKYVAARRAATRRARPVTESQQE